MTSTRAATEEDAANLALLELGEPPISTLADPVNRARVLRPLFGTIRDELLRERDWNFATAWSRPAADTVAAIGPLTTRFPLPDDCVKVRFLRNTATGQDNHDDWAIEAATVNPNDPAPQVAKWLVTNLTAPLICYTRRIEIVRLWDEEFVRVFAKRLAAAGAPAIARDRGAAEKLAGEAEGKLDQATRDDARERSPQLITRSTSWVTSRVLGVARSRAR